MKVMKVMKVIGLVLTIFLVGCTATATQKEEAYKQAMTHVEEIKVESLADKKEHYFLYVGRITCPHCLIFAPKLGQIVSETKDKVYYINSENSQANALLTEFRQKHDIKYVPFFGYFENGQLKAHLTITDNTTVDEIKSFIAQYKE